MRKIWILTSIIIAINCRCAMAESTIIAIPSASVVQKNTLILKESTGYRVFGSDQFVTIIPRIIYGAGKGIELSGGVQATIRDEPAVIGRFGVKKVFFTDSNTKLTFGARVNPDLNESVKSNNLIYSHLTHKINKTNTILVTGIAFLGEDRRLPNQAGAIIGFEQPVVPNKLIFASDWMSGDFGLLSFGFKYRFNPTLSVTKAISVPNNGDNLLFRFSISKSIPLGNRL